MRYGDKYGFYELNPFPGCNQIVVSNHAFIYPEFRGKGFGKLQHIERLEKAKELGYNYIICTVSRGNLQELHMLQMNCWVDLTWFKNTESDHTVAIWGRDL